MTLQERIEFFSNTSVAMLAQLRELKRLEELVQQAQVAASKSIRRKSGPPEMTGEPLTSLRSGGPRRQRAEIKRHVG